MNYIILVVIGYLFGIIPVSYIVGKRMGNLDVRKHGSGNAGATNILRTVGKKAALIALIGDIVKGIIPAIIGGLILGTFGAMICSSAAVIGHCYPVTLGFKGGKGVATVGGMVIGTNPLIALILIIYMVTIVKTTKFVSLASITASALYPVICHFVYHDPKLTVTATFIGIFIIFKHKANLGRLLHGSESKTTLFN